MHGLTVERINERIAERKPVWLRPLAERNKGKKPMRLLAVVGSYAQCEQEIAGKKRQMRIALDKVEYAPPPGPAGAKPKPIARAPKPRPFVPREPAPPSPIMRPTPLAPVTLIISKKDPPRMSSSLAKIDPGRYVVRSWASGRYYTDAHKWTEKLDEARVYDSEPGANKAAGRLRGPGGSCKGMDIRAIRVSEGVRMGDAKPFKDEEIPAAAEPAPEPAATVAPAVETPAPAAVPAAPQPAREPAPAIGATTDIAAIARAIAQPPPPASADIAAMQLALEHAMREEFEAMRALELRRIDVKRVQLEMDIAGLRRKNLGL